MNITPWTRRIGIIGLAVVVLGCLYFQSDQMAGTALGGLLMLINPTSDT